MMRIVSGKHKGRRIELLKEASSVRPTSEFAREAIFNILTHSKVVGDAPAYLDARVLDVFCGSGAFGLEALSRGAAQVTFIDLSREALASAHGNATRFGELDNVDFLQADATKMGTARQPFALVFLDPPYFSKLLGPALESLRRGGWIDADSLLVIEHDGKEKVTLPEGFTVVDERRYGRAVIKLLRLESL